jgi:hypothetical protein
VLETGEDLYHARRACCIQVGCRDQHTTTALTFRSTRPATVSCISKVGPQPQPSEDRILEGRWWHLCALWIRAAANQLVSAAESMLSSTYPPSCHQLPLDGQPSQTQTGLTLEQWRHHSMQLAALDAVPEDLGRPEGASSAAKSELRLHSLYCEALCHLIGRECNQPFPTSAPWTFAHLQAFILQKHTLRLTTNSQT